MIAALFDLFGLTRPVVYSVLGAFALGVLSTMWVEHKFQAHELAAAVNAAQAKERGGSAIVVKHDARAADILNKQLEAAHALNTRMALALQSQPACIVHPDVIRLLDASGVPGAAGAAAAPGGAPAAAPVDTNTVIASAADNYAAVCVPNAQQLAEVQAFYNEVRACFNSRGWFDRSCSIGAR